MKKFWLLLILPLLTACPSVDVGGAIKNSRASCVRTSGMGYSIVLTTANSDSNARTDDEVDINPDSCAMKIRNIGTKPAPKPDEKK